MIIVVLLSSSCQSKQKEKTKIEHKGLGDSSISIQPKKDLAITMNVARHFSFLDSISKKYNLSIEQIRTHTIIDSFYYDTNLNRSATFTGDTVFIIHNTFKGAIVNCYRGTGNYKLLIIFTLDGTENTDYKEIYSAGDSDGDEDNYSWDDYKLLTDSTFQTFESYTRHNSTKQGEKNKIKWQINDKGRIDSVLHKVK